MNNKTNLTVGIFYVARNGEITTIVPPPSVSAGASGFRIQTADFADSHWFSGYQAVIRTSDQDIVVRGFWSLFAIAWAADVFTRYRRFQQVQIGWQAAGDKA